MMFKLLDGTATTRLLQRTRSLYYNTAQYKELEFVSVDLDEKEAVDAW